MYLNCHSYHSLRYGTIPLEELISLAKENQVKAMALTDVNTITGIYDFYKACKANDIKPLVGIEFRQDNQLLYIGLAKNNKGVGELCSLRTKHNLEKTPLPDHAPNFDNVIVIYPMENVPPVLKQNEYIGLKPDQHVKLIQSHWKALIPKMVVLHPVTLRTKKEFNLHKILRAIDNNVILSKLTEYDYCSLSEKMIPLNEVMSIYSDYPSVIKNTEEIIDLCNFEFEFNTPRNKKYYTGTREGDRVLLEELALKGLKKIYGENHLAARERIHKELKVIQDLEFACYFLINWDIVEYSRSQGLAHVGRGSGANSIVSYCLGITAICPLELNLYFERFLNPDRSSPPDFDIDWSWQDRDKILEYIFNRFGKEHVAFCGTIALFKYRSIIRELGKVFGLAKSEMDILTSNRHVEHPKNSITKLVYEYGMMLEKYPNQRSMHSCGILISDEPITNFTALEMPPKGFPIVQFDMNIAEDIGLEKFDILSQRGLGSIKDCVELVKKNQGIIVDIEDTSISKDEPIANQLLKQGKTIGCFYVESPAMRGLIRKLKCDNYLLLTAASSIIRPGVAESGMMSEYVWRHNHPGEFEYPHPIFEEVLSDTYGVMVYQEDVMKIAHHFAGLPLKDADTLRRGKIHSKQYEAAKNLFFEKCRDKGYNEILIQEVFRQIQSFAGFSFCKAHSASYAVESYQSLYLKVNYPIEHMVAVINNFGGFYRTEVYIHEARMQGAKIHPSCVNKSEFNTTLYGKDVYLGFVHLNALPRDIVHKITEERNINGDYTSMENFINRIPAGIETIQILIYCGAFRFTGKTKNELTLMARMFFNRSKKIDRGLKLFDEPVRSYKLPEIERSQYEDAFDEIELFGFTISVTPFDILKTKARGNIFARHLPDMNQQTVKMLAYLISIKDVPTKHGLMNFGTWIDAEGNYFDTTHFADSLKKYPFQSGGCYYMQGKVEVTFGYPQVTIFRMEKLPFIPDPRYNYDEDRSYRVHEKIKEDISTTQRLPYPSDEEIGLPRKKIDLSANMNTSQITTYNTRGKSAFGVGNKESGKK